MGSALANLANGAIMSASVSKRVAGSMLEAEFDVYTSKAVGTYFSLNEVGVDTDSADNPTVVSNVCNGDLIATNNYDLAAVGITVGAQQYVRQVLKTETTAANAVLAKGSGGAHGASRLVVGAHNSFHKGHVEDTTAGAYVADIMPGVRTTAGAGNVLFRSSGGTYEIQTDINGDPSEFVCDNSGLRASYIASSAGYVSRAEPQIVRFVDASYGSAQPAMKPLSVFGGTQAGSPSALSPGDVIYVGSNKCSITAVYGRAGVMSDDLVQSAGEEDTNSVMGDEISGVECAETMVADGHSSADAIAVNEPVEILIQGATTSCYASDMRAIRFQRGNVADQSTVKVSAINNVNRQISHKDSTLNSPLVDYGDISVGDRVMLAVGNSLYETRTIDSIATNYKSFTVSKGFSASVTTSGEYTLYIVGKGSKGHSECSGRGLCDDANGQCSCFKGYTKQACSEQSALAA